MTILAILQNQWFKDPEAVQDIYNRNPDKRNNLIARFLFMGCLTGRRLREAFGGELCDRIIWEEASPKVGGFSASKFRADTTHLAGAIEQHKPDLILCFGKIASDGVKSLNLSIPVLCAPHPAARQNPMPALKEIAQKVIENSIREVILRHYAMYYSGATAEEIARLGKMSEEDVDTGLAALIADGKTEAFPRGGAVRYYPLANERQKYFTMETPEESAGMQW